ncbi:MAG: hypothetical protein VX346_26750 [Planctomycetota bacterium]|nr:hypothetical protein [Planctomycetota bacterium]
MASADFRKYADELVSEDYLQSEIQTAFNDVVTATIDLAKSSGHPVTLDEVRDYLLNEVLAPESDDDHWNAFLRKRIALLKIVDPDTQIYKTMSFGGGDERLSSGLHDVVKSALKREESQKKK